MDATVTDPLVGIVLDGRYRIDHWLAEGGMSTVYAGTDLRLDRRVAVKVMTPSLANNPVFLERFVREAKAAARLSHVNVVAVYDQGVDRGPRGTHAFLVMELVRGVTLRDLLAERGPLPPAEALAVLEPVLAGLSAAHRTGLVHRDVKPENVLISAEGVVKVADFGLARAVAATSRATRSGDVLIGTVAYLSPEQVQSGTASPRSDVYATGILLYEMLTGAPPYAADNALSVAYQHVHSDVPPPSRRAPDVPPELDRLTHDATRREPSARPLDAGVFLAELFDARADLGLPRVPVPIGRSRLTAGPGRSTEHGTTVLHRTRAQPRPTPTAGRTGPLPPAGRPVRSRRRGRRWLTLLVVLLLGAGGIGAGWWFGSGRYTDVPRLVTLSRADAVAAAQQAGVDIVFADPVFSEVVPDGQVITTEPAAGERVIRGTDVTAVLSQGAERFYIDAALVGAPVADVRTALAAADLPVEVSEREEYDDAVNAGRVAGFEPVAGTPLRRGQTVVLVVSLGHAPVAVPDLAGRSRDDAVRIAQDAGLNTNVTEQFSNDVPAGEVLGQDPGPDADPVPYRSTITIVVSKGPDLVAVPDVDGLLLSEATRILEDADFVVVGTCFVCSDGEVEVQDPPAGTRILRGSTVELLAF